jgi:NADH-quinone oxidoreductase subunit E
MAFSEETLIRAKEIVARYPEGKQRSALLPMLHLVQSDEGFVSPEGIGFCAEQLGLTRAQVSAVATFYTMYKRRPAGDWLVSVCTNTMCDVLGGREVYEQVSEHLGAGHDETTADGKITLEHAECLAACDYGPVMTVNYEFFDRVDVDSALGLVTQLQEGGRPIPSRGARLCTLKEMSLQLAGFADPRAEAIADGVTGDATLRGNRLAEQHGVSVADFDPDTPIVKPKPEAKE